MNPSEIDNASLAGNLLFLVLGDFIEKSSSKRIRGRTIHTYTSVLSECVKMRTPVKTEINVMDIFVETSSMRKR